ncbi:MAG TPA: tRNA dihydrouridine synthase DusB [Burkholderiaceae bacterium]|nr:tRNA dihydrouridine synthase DusB [Burkholderiaceae bacterium]
MRIGPHLLPNNVFVAPMAGVTDRPFRQLCKQLGAGYAVSEMAASNPRLWATDKTTRRLNHAGEIAPVAVQIAGSDPAMLAEAAKFNVDKGAAIIDINMGCPAKKVCNVACGSALLRDEPLVARLLEAVVRAVDVPVTLKFRTGWDRSHRNALTIARMAQEAGIAMLTLHGRTRADLYTGQAEYETIAAVKAAVSIPVVANGDIDSPQKAKQVLALTGADAVMIGRAGQGRPWIYGQVAHYLATGELKPDPKPSAIKPILLEHLEAHYAFYGEFMGVRTARKHIGWYTEGLIGSDAFWQRLTPIEDTQAQWQAVSDYFDELIADGDELRYSIQHAA